jgi:hypothetical protein
MNPEISIRNETAADVGVISDLTAAAFKTLEISKHTGQFIIASLPPEVFFAPCFSGQVPKGVRLPLKRT